MKTRSAVSILLATAALAAPASAADRILRATLTLPAPIEDVWAAWTTEEGVKTFFAPGAHIEPQVDGAYEIFFNPAGPPGHRGADGMRVLAFDPPRRLAFTWNAPPTIPAIRGQRTMVVVELEPAGPRQTHLRFTHLGWGEGKDWDTAYEYFDHAWNAVVLARLQRRFASGPIDWSSKEMPPPVASSLRLTLRQD
jgi:uncharacterized protein YndB with AHSA1/START domain